jgi:ribosomal protein S18 acetylase RimI-like enzyme
VSRLLTAVAAECARGDAALALARIDGHLVGFGYWRRYQRPTHRPHADLEKVAVSRRAQGCGVGRCLTEVLVSAARTQAIEQLTLELPADNHVSHELCTSMGFREYGRLPEFVAVGDRRYDKIVCVLDLR